MLKDKLLVIIVIYLLLQLGKMKFHKVKCNYCKSGIHSIVNCPAFHFIPDREKIIKIHSFPNS